MIPFSPGIFLVMAILGLIVLATPVLIIYSSIFALRVYFIARKEQVPFVRLLFKSKFFIITLVLTTILTVFSGFILVNEYLFTREFNKEQANRESRRNFVLPEDHLYGEIVFPKGSLIKRYDGSDNGEADKPLSLGGLEAVRFPYPVEIAGIKTIALDAYPGRLELSEDQAIGPFYYLGYKDSRYGELIKDRTQATIECRKGDIALFDIPSRDSDLEDYNEEGVYWKYQDGAQAHFKPSEWLLIGCETDREIIVPPAYGSEEALALEKEAEEQRKASETKTVVRDGVLMDAEPTVLDFGYYLDAVSLYHSTAQKSENPEDYLQAYELFQKGADNNETKAYFYLGVMNELGEGVPQNMPKAVEWFNKAINAGDLRSISRLGDIYLNGGAGVSKDYEKARELFLQADESGSSNATLKLGMMSAEGLGTPQNYHEALKWLKKAGTRGNALAIYNVGNLYAEGLLGEVDLIKAEPWYEKACQLEFEKACEKHDSISEKIDK